MTQPASLAALPPILVVHLLAACAAFALGPFALWSRKGSSLHRAAGKGWVALMALTAFTALFIHATKLPNVFGFTPIHLLILTTAYGIGRGIHHVRRGDIARHRTAMRATYVGACIIAGAFTLLPGRYLGDLLWHHLLGIG